MTYSPDMKNVLFIVYYFPPMGGSGVQRPLKFVKYLREFGWNPIILCPEPGAYHTFDQSLNSEFESLNITTHRVQGNTPLHYGGTRSIQLPSAVDNFLRKISTFFWLPDNKKGWIRSGYERALEIIESEDIDLIYATAAPYSNLLLAAELKKSTGKKTVMDLRDEWLESHLIKYPTPYHRKKMADIEQETLEEADLITVINDSYKDSFGKRYPGLDIRVVNQGFDPEDFEVEVTDTEDVETLSILYSGLFYGDRTPDLFFKSVMELKSEQPELMKGVVFEFQGGLDEIVRHKIAQFGLISDIIDHGYLDHDKAVKNVATADGLWLMIGHQQNAEHVTVGKMFEYFGSKKPILGLVPEGISMKLLQEYGVSYLANPNQKDEIKKALGNLINDIKEDKLPEVNQNFIDRYNRKKITKDLASVFNEISS